MSGQSPIQVLVIDDDVTQQLLVKEYLEPAGFVVRLAEDGRRGLKLASTLRPQVIILDLLLPSLDGYTVCTCLKETPSTADIPVILMTGSRESDVIQRGLAAGAADFVTKPVDWEFLADRVRHVLRQNQGPARHDDKARGADSRLRATERPFVATVGQRPGASPSQGAQAAPPGDEQDDASSLGARPDEQWAEKLRLAVAAARAEGEARLREAERTAAQAVQGRIDEIHGAAEAEIRGLQDEARLEADSIWQFVAGATHQQLEGLRVLQEKIAVLRSMLAHRNSIEHVQTTLAEVGMLASSQTLTADNLRLLAIHAGTTVRTTDTVIDLAAMVAVIAGEVGAHTNRRDVRIVHRCQPGIRMSIDQHRMRFALMSILGNAIKFSPPNGRVEITGSLDSEGAIVIQIADHGFGIVPTLLDQLHACLDHPKNLVTSSNGKIGYGIPLSKAFVELHGGAFDIDSERGKGTTVTITLPATRRATVAADGGAGQMRAAG